MIQKQHLINLLSYIGIWLIAGSISHGFFSGTRSIITALIGIVLFLAGEYLKWDHKSYLELFIFALIYSVAIGMVSGWIQHFLDSPTRSLWIVPAWYLISLIVYPYKEWLHGYNFAKTLMWWIIVSVILYWLLYLGIRLLPSTYFMTDHHDNTVSTTSTHISTLDIQTLDQETHATPTIHDTTTHVDNNIDDHH